MPLRALLAGGLVACVATAAEAAGARHRLSISPKSYADALIDLGIQANVSIVGTSACGRGGPVALQGRYTVEEALARLLDGAPCQFRIVDARTVRITPAPTPAAPPVERPPADQPMLVSELVVTAAKRPASLDLLPAGVSAVSRAQIAATGAGDVGQTIGQVAGVLTTNLGPGRDKLLIRALSDGTFTGRARSTVSTYLDHAPLNYNAPDPDLRLVDIERIEVVRGPQGALYGSGSLSGVYRIITRKPDPEAVAGGVGATFAATKGGDPSEEVEGYLNLPLAGGRAAVRLVAYHDERGGYLDDTPPGATNVDRTVRDGGRLAVRLRLGDTWRVDALAATQHLRSDNAQYVNVVLSTGASRGNRIREGHDNDFTHGAVTIQGDLGGVSLVSSSAYVHHTFTSQYDASSVDDPLLPGGAFNAAPADTVVYLENTRVNMLVEDLVLRSRTGGRFRWLAGVYGSLTLERSPSSADIFAPGAPRVPAYREHRKDRVSELALYGEVDYALAPGWTLSVGGRLFGSWVRTSADVWTWAPNGPRVVAYERRFQGVSPKISLQREIGERGAAYALISEGHRPGGFNTAGITPLREIRTTFGADRLRNYEAGLKLRFFDGRMAVRSAAYFAEWRDIQTDQYRITGLAYTANVADAETFGLEGEIGYDWDFGLSVQANALLADSRVTDKNPNFTGRVADELPAVPDVSGGVIAIYQRPFRDDLVLRLVGEASYVGRSALSFDATINRPMAGYVRARLSAELAADGWSAAAFVSNPLDDDSDTFAYGNPFSFRGLRQVTPQRPRTIGVRLAANF
ncbi:TonB-dependent receptor [Phenylobacterium zucineum HLK1]|uniref:TonB-dependent receptor n=1 Tax=Phenylobacterium zucineum (strain HLK1) TaxID=450851 RepID=B4RF75_PHEZH|nr:TonB-dependent receptor [Phenylobacterium zucineum]ACG78645.1 TonB-dependent receptor [Phenylobacterium zucineum HLK1]